MSLHYCIWGCGFRGKNVFSFMKGENICAFVDTNPALQGTRYKGVPIISFEEYLKKYRDCVIIVSPYMQSEITAMLAEHKIAYFSTLDLPAEIHGVPRPDLFQIAEKKLRGKTVFLYRLNLYSLLFYEYLLMQEGYATKIIPEQDVPVELRSIVELCFPECLESLEAVGNEPLYITSNKYVNNRTLPGNTVELYDFMDDISDYHNPVLEKFRDAHKGKRCFIIATGPSLRTEDLERLADNHETCISMNGIFKLYSSTRWRPSYYLIHDTTAFAEWKDELMCEGKVDNMLASDTCLGNIPYKNFLKYHIATWGRPPKFSKDFAKGVYNGSTITYTCLQFAVYLGCTEIYLYGLDFDYSKDQNHFTTEYESGDNKDSNACIQDQELAKMKAGYEVAKRVADGMGIKIYNASRYSKLDVFERVGFDSLFDAR